MKKLAILAISGLFISSLLAKDALAIEFKPETSIFLEKKNDLLPFFKKYIDTAFNKRDPNKLLQLYRKQKSDEDRKELLSILKAQIALLKDEEIVSIVVLDVEEAKVPESSYTSEMAINFHVKTTNFQIPVHLIILLDSNDNRWHIKEKLKTK